MRSFIADCAAAKPARVPKFRPTDPYYRQLESEPETEFGETNNPRCTDR